MHADTRPKWFKRSDLQCISPAVGVRGNGAVAKIARISQLTFRAFARKEGTR